MQNKIVIGLAATGALVAYGILCFAAAYYQAIYHL